MLKVITPQMRDFMTAGPNEEAVDQPIYHIQSYGTAGATSFTFFNTAVGSATNGLSDTNMDASAVLSAGKRYAVTGIGIAVFGSSPHVVDNTGAFVSPVNDIKGIIEGIGNFTFRVLDKVYYQCAPLAYLPAGFGAHVTAGGVQRTQVAAANGTSFMGYVVNGTPAPTALRKLRVPIPVPQQVRFEAVTTFPTAVTVGTASRFGVFLDGLLVRARQ